MGLEEGLEGGLEGGRKAKPRSGGSNLNATSNNNYGMATGALPPGASQFAAKEERRGRTKFSAGK